VPESIDPDAQAAPRMPWQLGTRALSTAA